MKFFNKLLSVVLSLCLCISGVSVSAAEITSHNGAGTSPVELSMDSSSFSVSLPLGLLVQVTSTGEIYTATEAYIINNCRSPIIVEDVLVETNSPWELVNFDSAFYSMPVNTPKLGFQLNSENVGTDGKVALSLSNWPVIYGFDRMQLDYDANLPAISADKQDIMGNVVFTIGFWESDDNTVISSTKFNSAIFDIKDEYQFSVDVEQESVTIDEPAEDSLWVWTTNDDSTLTIVGYNGDLDASQDIVVPSEINGATVTTLADGTFNSGSAFTVNSMSIPEGMTVEAKSLYGINADTVNIANNCVLEAKSLALCDVENLYIGEGITLPGSRTATTTTQGRNKSAADTILGYSSEMMGGSVTNLYLNSDATPGCFEDCYIDNAIFGEGCTSLGRFAFSVGDTLKSFKGIENIKFFGMYCFAEAGASGYIYPDSCLDENFKSPLIITSDTIVEEYGLAYITLSDVIIKSGAEVGNLPFAFMSADSMSIEDASLLTNIGATYSFLRKCNIGTLNIDGNIPNYFAYGQYMDAFNGKNNFTTINLGPNVASVGKYAFGNASGASRDYLIESITGLENVQSIGNNTFTYVGMNTVVLSNTASISSNVFNNSEITTISVGPDTEYYGDSFRYSGAEIIVREE